MAVQGTRGGAGGRGATTEATTRLHTVDPHIVTMMRDVMDDSATAPRLTVCAGSAGGGGGGGGGVTCFLPKQLISMSDGTHKPILDIVVGDMIKTYDMKSKEIKDSPVNKTQTKLHTNVYELHLDNGKTLHPTGNHPFLTKEKDWTTIDGHEPNHAGGSGYLKVNDCVYDIDEGWIKVTKIIAVDGEHLTYNFIDMEYGTIIADAIVTHNSGEADNGVSGSNGTAASNCIVTSSSSQGGYGGAGHASSGNGGGGGGGGGGNGGAVVIITTSATYGTVSVAAGSGGTGGNSGGNNGQNGFDGAVGKLIHIQV
jgi:hypothetical protein